MSFKANVGTNCTVYIFELYRLNVNERLVVALKRHQRDIEVAIGARNKYPYQEEAVS
jgi:hypothetical protein